MSDENNHIWADPDVSEGASPSTNISHELGETVKRLENLKQHVQQIVERHGRTRAGTLEVKKYKSIPYCSILIVDSVEEGKVCRYTPYLPHTDSAEVPSFDITSEKNGKLFAQYEKAFDTVWGKATTIKELSYTPAQSKEPNAETLPKGKVRNLVGSAVRLFRGRSSTLPADGSQR